MKQGFLFFITGLVCFLFAAGTQAQINTFFTVNYTVPANDITKDYDPGFGASGELFVILPLLPIRLGVHLGYSRFTEGNTSTKGDLRVWEAMPVLKYQIFASDDYSVWTQFGLGIYKWKNGVTEDSDLGTLVGIGFSRKVTDFINFVFMPTYQKVISQDISYFTWNLGVRF